MISQSLRNVDETKCNTMEWIDVFFFFAQEILNQTDHKYNTFFTPKKWHYYVFKIKNSVDLFFYD